MPKNLKHHSIVSIGGDIIVIGGSDDEEIIIEETPTHTLVKYGIVITVKYVCSELKFTLDSFILKRSFYTGLTLSI